MKKTSLILSSLLIGVSAFASSVLPQNKIDQLKADFPKMVGNPALTIVAGVDQGSFYQLKIQAKGQRGRTQTFDLYITQSKTPTIFIGKAFDKNGNIYMNQDIIKKGVAFSFGTGKKELYLVTDPECPYCQRLEASISKEALKDYKINVIPMPLSFHKESKPMLYWVLSAKTNKEKAERMHSVMTGSQDYKSFKVSEAEKIVVDKIIDKSNIAANELGARGTPSVYGPDMKKVDYSFLVNKPKAKPVSQPALVK